MFIFDIYGKCIDTYSKVDNDEIEITESNYMDINHYLFSKGVFDEMMFIINGELFYCNNSFIKFEYVDSNVELYNESVRVFEWLLINEFKFESNVILVPELKGAFDSKCFRSGTVGVRSVKLYIRNGDSYV